ARGGSEAQRLMKSVTLRDLPQRGCERHTKRLYLLPSASALPATSLLNAPRCRSPNPQVGHRTKVFCCECSNSAVSRLPSSLRGGTQVGFPISSTTWSEQPKERYRYKR